jgi:lactate dehydrogenase-like 2-hydroxyacid dehydrogenase
LLKKPKVFIPPFMARYEKVIQILEPVVDIEYIDGKRYKEQLTIAKGMIGGRINEEILQNAPRFKVVARYGVGYDDCDVEAMTRHKVYLCHTPGVLSDAVADLVMALLLTCNRKIVQADRYVREGWVNRAPGRPTFGVDLKGKTLGIVGLGRIGFEVAKRCVLGFEMGLMYYDIIRNQRAEEELGAEFMTLEEVLKKSDFISVNVTLNPKSRGMIGEEQLRMMKRTAYIINTSRGPVLDQAALVRVLSEGAIAGAGLDVFEKEPIPHNDPLLKLQNVVLSPHIGSATEEAREAMAICDAENITVVMKGEVPPPNVVPEQQGMVFKR